MKANFSSTNLIMINIKIFTNETDDIISFISYGHSNFAEKGKDIVCAMVSVLLQTALMSLEVLIEISVKATKNEGFLEVVLPDNISSNKRRDCNLILNTMVIGLSKIQDEYPDYVKLNFLYSNK